MTKEQLRILQRLNDNTREMLTILYESCPSIDKVKLEMHLLREYDSNDSFSASLKAEYVSGLAAGLLGNFKECLG